MTNAIIDENSVAGLIGTLQSDGSTIVRVKANASNGAIKVVDSSAGTYNGSPIAKRDENERPVLMATSSADGFTPIAVAVDASGNLLVKST